ncbi:hypothetical protein P885DRAFT_31696 [Corynascus similis CBS 632.67]
MDASAEAQQRDAVAEGRRIYLGNLLYSVKPGDVEDMLRQAGFGDSLDKLHISIDPISGRNPGYCFAEFVTRDEAERALETLPGSSLFQRPVKVGPCHPKSSSGASSQSRWGSSATRGGESGGYNPTFQRWGDWRGSDARPARQQQQREGGQKEQGPHGAIRHLESRSQRFADKAQLYIGGLGKMINQEQHDAELQEILAGFEYVAISKRITPRAETRATPGNHHYCFVDFSSAEEAQRAIKELNGKPLEGGGSLRVSLPRSKGPAFEQDGTTNHGWRNGGASSRQSEPLVASGNSAQESGGQESREGQGQERPARREPTEKQRAIMTSNNWRSRAAAV